MPMSSHIKALKAQVTHTSKNSLSYKCIEATNGQAQKPLDRCEDKQALSEDSFLKKLLQ